MENRNILRPFGSQNIQDVNFIPRFFLFSYINSNILLFPFNNTRHDVENITTNKSKPGVCDFGGTSQSKLDIEGIQPKKSQPSLQSHAPKTHN